MEGIITGWRRYALVQPPVMVILFAYSMTGTILTDLIVYETCTITLGINKTECLILHENSSSAEALKIDAQVQPRASLILMSKSFIDSILPALFSLFLGPWSDKYGRKPLLLLGFTGTSLTYFLLSLLITWNISPWFLLLAYIPSVFLGGFSILILACICYISDITNEQERVWHLAWMEALICLGLLMGTFVGPFIFHLYGYIAVFSTATICCFLAELYVCFFVPETIHNTDSRTFSSLFDSTLVKDLVRTCTKKRDGFNRSIVWCCIASMTLSVVNMQGSGTIEFLFTSARLGWSVSEYSIYSATNLVLTIFGTITGIKLLRTYGGLSEEVVSILSVMSSLGSAITRCFAFKPWHMYLSIVIDMFSGLASPTIRAILSKAVPSQDTGKVFSLTISLETLAPVGAASLFSIIYSSTMPPMYPSPVWLVSASIFVVIIILLTNIKIQNAKSDSARYAQLFQDSGQSS